MNEACLHHLMALSISTCIHFPLKICIVRLWLIPQWIESQSWLWVELGPHALSVDSTKKKNESNPKILQVAYPDFSLREITGFVWEIMGFVWVFYGFSISRIYWNMGDVWEEYGILPEEYGILWEEYGISWLSILKNQYIR